MKKNKFDFGFADDDEPEDSGLPSTMEITVPGQHRQAPATSKVGKSSTDLLGKDLGKKSALKPAELPNTESFLQANSSIVDQGATNVQSAAQRINELNKLELP